MKSNSPHSGGAEPGVGDAAGVVAAAASVADFVDAFRTLFGRVPVLAAVPLPAAFLRLASFSPIVGRGGGGEGRDS